MRLLEDRDFIERLHELYGAVPDAIRENAELRKVFLPILRADVALLETYDSARVEPLDCPITVFGGEGDPAVTAKMLQGWKQFTSVEFAQRQFAGEHFYLLSEREAVVAELVRALRDSG